MFTTNHFIWMGICAAMIGLLLFVSLKFKFSRRKASVVMALIAAASEVCKILTHIEEAPAGGGVLEPESLPLHLCSILIFLVFFCAFSRHETQIGKVASLCAPVSLWGGALAILMATSGVSFTQPSAGGLAFESGIAMAVMVPSFSSGASPSGNFCKNVRMIAFSFDLLGNTTGSPK